MRIDAGRLVKAGFGLALVILGAVSVGSYRAVTRLIESSASVSRAHESVQKAQQLTTEMVEVESACRGYMLSGAEELLQADNAATVRVRKRLDELRHLAEDNPAQRKWIEQLEPLIEQKLAFHLHAAATRRERGFDAALPLFQAGTGRQLMAQVRSVVAAIEAEQRALLARRAEELQVYARRSLAGWIGATLLSVAILICIYFYLEREIRRRRRSEGRLIHLNRLYAVLTHVSQVVVRIQDRDELFQAVCRITVEDGQFCMAWVGLLDPEKQAVLPAAHFGHEAGYLEHARIVLGDQPEGRGPTGNCLRQGRYVVTNDIEADPLMSPWRGEALQRGYRASAAFPIAVDGRLVGAFSVYASEAGYYDPGIIQLLEEVASELSFALKNIQEQEQRRRAEEEVLRLNEVLEHRVVERTAELGIANQQLAARNQEVEQTNRLKSAFLARMSHELRTPLNAILGFADLLAEGSGGALSDKQRRFVGHVQGGARHLLQVINDILDLSKIDAGRIEIEYEAFLVSDALGEVLSMIRPLAGIKRIGIGTAVPADLEICADRTRFKQILYNLLSNAVKFTPEGGTVRVESCVDGGSIRFTVADTGVGIPVDEHQAIFDEFHQVSATTRGLKEGTGLGLAITRRLVELHGGQIWVESHPDQGSRFYFTLPPGSGDLTRARGAGR